MLLVLAAGVVLSPLWTGKSLADAAPAAASGLPAATADIPKLPWSYGAARRTLMDLGYKPTNASKFVWSACARALDSDDYITCDADLPLPEIANCAGTGEGFCEAYWLAPDQRVLRVVTIGEPQPGAIYQLEWATPEQLADLPVDWKP